MADRSIHVERALLYVEAHYEKQFLTATAVEEAVANNSPHIRAQFKREVGFTIGKWINARRMQRARELLVTTERTVSDIAFSVGYDYHEVFCRAFRRFHGTSPTEYRERASKIVKRNDQADLH